MISTIEKQLYDKKCLKVMAMKSTRGGGVINIFQCGGVTCEVVEKSSQTHSAEIIWRSPFKIHWTLLKTFRVTPDGKTVKKKANTKQHQTNEQTNK